MEAFVTDGGSYEAPRVEDYGSLAELTADIEVSYGLLRSVSMLAVVSTTIISPGPSDEPSGPLSSVAPDANGIERGGSNGGAGDIDDDGVPSGDGGGGVGDDDASGSSGGGGSGGLSGSLPFTGYLLSLVAALGMTLALAGAWLRQRFRPR